MPSPDHAALLTIADVMAMTGYKSRSSLYRLMKQQKCPCPIVIGGNHRTLTAAMIDSHA